ncbi:cytochrome-c oxidase, cbb3-type subunit III [Coralliovum pocilloporae]|uniref:cytochrome-c oxidase, cbb3-type subunit III n=1 Tax=Coralliovum pocilloporae TaxID=3066369 RepID=UPI003306AFB6
MADQKKVDELSGVATTGHEWDGIEELNNPLPRWWLWMFYVTIIWAFLYWIAMPSWPLVSSYTTGILGHSQRANVLEDVAQAKAARSELGQGLINASLEDIQNTADLLEFAMASGSAAFGDNCAPCHGSGAQGSRGFPNLNDDDWLWGGDLDSIHETIRVGIRSGHDEERSGDMTAFGRDEILEKDEIQTVAAYVRSMSGLQTLSDEQKTAGEELFADNCAACHAEDGTGEIALGAPNLTDGIWLFGSSMDDVVETITNGRKGVMPAWDTRLDEVTVKSLAVYVHSLGGGQ